MSHIALYRAWRPKTFREIVGQEHITRTLQNALREQRISHAYLFSGPRGTGKTSAAKILARAVNCEHGPAEEPCNECHVCQRIHEGAVMDVIEIDAASNRGVDEIRDLRDNVKYAPTEARYKVYIVDEVHMLTTEAFNALLKTLEEPPAHVLFILATTEPHRLPATILSRCQRFDFKRVALTDQVNRLQFICSEEEIDIDEDALQYIAKLSDGGMRDALSLLDQAISYVEGKITYEQVVDMTGGIEGEQFATLAEAIHAQDVGRALQWVKIQLNAGKSADKCLESLLFFYRDLLVMKLVPTSSAMTDRILDVDRYQRIADLYDEQQIFAIIDVLNRYQTEMKYAPHPQLLFEVALMRMCTLEQTGAQTAQPAQPAQSAQAAHSAQAMQTAPTTPMARTTTDAEMPAAARRTPPPAPSAPFEPFEQTPSRAPSRPSVPPSVSAQSEPAPMRTAQASDAPTTAVPNRNQGDGPVSAQDIIERFVKGKDEAVYSRVEQQWDKVIARLKEVKITVSAWLVNGSPVSANQEAVLVAFKNLIHRNTTEKPANKQLIEQVIHEIIGMPLRLHTMMRADWDKIPQDIAASTADEYHRAASEQAATALAEPLSLPAKRTESLQKRDEAEQPGLSEHMHEASDVLLVPDPLLHDVQTDAQPQGQSQVQQQAQPQVPPQSQTLQSKAQATGRPVAEGKGTDAGSVSGQANVEAIEASTSDEPKRADASHSHEQEWIREAVQFFGEELVVVEDDRNRNMDQES